MSPRRGSLQMKQWNTPTSRVWGCMCAHCQRVSVFTHTHTHHIITHMSSFSWYCCVCADISIFTLKEVLLQRDPGYRNSSYPETGVCIIYRFLCSDTLIVVSQYGSVSVVSVVLGTDSRWQWSCRPITVEKVD